MFRLVLIEQLLLRRRKDRGASYEEISFLEDKFQKGLIKFTERTFSETKLPLQMFFGIQISFLESEMYIL